MGEWTRNQVSRRGILKAGLGIGAAAGLAPLSACGSSNSGSSGESGKPQGTITVWMHEEEVYSKLFQSFVDDYHKQYPAVTVKPLYIPLAQLDTKLATAFTGDAAPDVFKTGGWTLPSYVAKNQLDPINLSAFGAGSLEAFKARFQPNALSAVTVHDKVYGAPIDFNSTCLYYRKDRFAAAGLDPNSPPTTWEQVADYSKKLTGAGPTGKQIGWQWFLTTPIWSVLELTPLVDGLGGSILNKDASAGSLNSPAGIKALQYLASVGDPKLSNKNDVYGMFADGTAAMFLSSAFAVALEPTMNPAAVFGKTFDVAPVPQWQNASKKAASGYSWAWGVSAKSKNRYTAWHFINYLQSKSVVDQELKVSNLIVPIKGWQNDPAAGGKQFQTIAGQVEYTDFGSPVASWNEMGQTLTDTIAAVANGQKSPERAAKDFDSAMKGVLG